jgi:hypothetical protein
MALKRLTKMKTGMVVMRTETKEVQMVVKEKRKGPTFTSMPRLSVNRAEDDSFVYNSTEFSS